VSKLEVDLDRIWREAQADLARAPAADQGDMHRRLAQIRRALALVRHHLAAGDVERPVAAGLWLGYLAGKTEATVDQRPWWRAGRSATGARKAGGRASAATRRERAKDHEAQATAEKIWAGRPHLSIRRVADLLEKKHLGRAETLRKKLTRPGSRNFGGRRKKLQMPQE
jgi:hypothetical protein